jgi:hypothetical protein
MIWVASPFSQQIKPAIEVISTIYDSTHSVCLINTKAAGARVIEGSFIAERGRTKLTTISFLLTPIGPRKT